MLQVTSLGSGSCGNAFLVQTPGVVLMVDCGVGVRRMTRALAGHGLSLTDVDAVLISHEHSDHVRELPRFTTLQKPIVSTRGTATAANVPMRSWSGIKPGESVACADVDVFAIPVSHDAFEPCGFLIRSASGAVTVLTDLGRASPAAAEAISESSLVVLEANHDETVLRRGPYPAHLQRRILSDNGHLSNAACADLLATALKRSCRLPTVWLAHLSETNNRPSLAKKTVDCRLASAGLRLDVRPLPRRDVSVTWRSDMAFAGVAQLSLDFPSRDGH